MQDIISAQRAWVVIAAQKSTIVPQTVVMRQPSTLLLGIVQEKLAGIHVKILDAVLSAWFAYRAVIVLLQPDLLLHAHLTTISARPQ